MNARLRERPSSLSSPDSSRPPSSRQPGVADGDGCGVAGLRVRGKVGGGELVGPGVARVVPGVELAAGGGGGALPAQAESQRVRQARGRRLFMVK